jgi:hypothetical protein
VHEGIALYVKPLLTEIATSNLAIPPVPPDASHVMLKGVPVASFSPPLGVSTLTDKGSPPARFAGAGSAAPLAATRR